MLKYSTEDLLQENKEQADLACTCSADIFAVGVVAYELLNGVPPFSRMDRCGGACG